MMRNCLLPPRHLLLICNDSSLSIYDDLHVPKIWDKPKPVNGTIDKVELELDKQFSELVSNKASLQAKKTVEKFDDKINQTELKFTQDVKDNAVQEPLKTYNIKAKSQEKSCSTEQSKASNNKTEDGTELIDLDVDKCVLTEKNMNIDVIGTIIDPTIYRENFKKFSNYLININLFNKAKVKIVEYKQVNRQSINKAIDNKVQSTFFSNANSINTNFLQRNSGEVYLRKRKGLKRKATEIDIVF
jgi:hypothetical protein